MLSLVATFRIVRPTIGCSNSESIVPCGCVLLSRTALQYELGNTNSAVPATIIVNADDLGADSEVNQAIIQSFERGLISSASIMPNMPGFDEACDLIDAGKLHTSIGVHLNLSQGKSLTEGIRKMPRFWGPDGFRGRVRAFRLSAQEVAAVTVELDAQVQAVLTCIPQPSHFDSHHHIHTEWAIGAVVMRLAGRYGIPCIRISRNIGPRVGITKHLYKYLFNRRLSQAGLARSRYFGSAQDVAPVLQALDGKVEIGVHPRLNEQGIICDYETGPEMARQHAELGLPDLRPTGCI